MYERERERALFHQHRLSRIRPVPVQNLFSEAYVSTGELVGLLGWGIGPM
jgi:hypothetical protein